MSGVSNAQTYAHRQVLVFALECTARLSPQVTRAGRNRNRNQRHALTGQTKVVLFKTATRRVPPFDVPAKSVAPTEFDHGRPARVRPLHQQQRVEDEKIL